MSAPLVKICGVTRLDDALAAASAGAAMLGLNLYPPSPRSLTLEAAAALARALRSALGVACPLLVGVFVNDTADAVAYAVITIGLDAAQLHGDEDPAALMTLASRRVVAFKAVRPPTIEAALGAVAAYAPVFHDDRRLPSLLIDAHHPTLYGGSGQQASDALVQAVRASGHVPCLMLAGGLTPTNVSERVRALGPWGVDVAGGVEIEGQPGVKDTAKVRAFITAAQHATDSHATQEPQ